MGEVDDKDDDGIVDVGDVRHLLAGEVFEDGFGLNPGHDSGAGKVERHRHELHGVAGEELLKVVLDDFRAAGGLVIHHAVEVVEVEAAAVDEQFSRADEVHRVLGLEPLEEAGD